MKLSLIIDGNFLLYKDVFILKKLRRIKQDLKELLLNDLTKLSKSFPFENIYFVSDSKEGNWRKREYKHYKGERTKDDTIDWDFVYQCYSEFKDIVKSRKNVKFLEMSGLEGDDFIGHIITENNIKGVSNLIVASDKDIFQKLTFDLNKKYINIQWNYKFSDERVYLPENYQLILDELSNNVNENLFELDDSSDFVKFLENIINRTKTKTVSTEESAFVKLIHGDDGDNIPSCIYTKDGKVTQSPERYGGNGDGRGIGEDGAKTLYKLFKEIHPQQIDVDSDTFLDNLTDVVIYYKKIKDTTAKQIIKDNLIFNRKMMILDTKYMPKITFENMKNYFNEIDNRVVVYESEDLESKLEEDDFFNEKEMKLPEQFMMERDTEEAFDPDSFWDL